MPDEYDELPLPEAEQQLRAEIEEHRTAMGRLGRRRAQLLADEVDRRGRGGPAQIAEELGLSLPAVNKLVHEARRARRAHEE
ncbi:hypothetical protein GCM10009783_18810 [Glycomyces lechevalierae]